MNLGIDPVQVLGDGRAAEAAADDYDASSGASGEGVERMACDTQCGCRTSELEKISTGESTHCGSSYFLLAKYSAIKLISSSV